MVYADCVNLLVENFLTTNEQVLLEVISWKTEFLLNEVQKKISANCQGNPFENVAKLRYLEKTLKTENFLHFDIREHMEGVY